MYYTNNTINIHTTCTKNIYIIQYEQYYLYHILQTILVRSLKSHSTNIYTVRTFILYEEYLLYHKYVRVVDEESFPSNLRTPSDSVSCMWLKARRHYLALLYSHFIYYRYRLHYSHSFTMFLNRIFFTVFLTTSDPTFLPYSTPPI